MATPYRGRSSDNQRQTALQDMSSKRTPSMRPLRYLAADLAFSMGIAIVAGCWILWWLIETHHLEPLPTNTPSTMHAIFGEYQIIEKWQHRFLLAGAIASGGIAFIKRYMDVPVRHIYAPLLLCLGLLLMYFEDVYNTRHLLADLTTSWVFQEELTRRNWVRILTEFTYYGFIAMFMLGAAAFGWRFVRSNARVKGYFVLGYSCYALASLASASRYIGDWYDKAGAFLMSVMPSALSRDIDKMEGWLDEYPAAFWLIDFAVEESVEMFAASSLLAGIIAFGISSSIMMAGSFWRQQKTAG